MKIDKKHIEWLDSLPPHLYTTTMEMVTGKMSIMQKLSWQMTRLDRILFDMHWGLVKKYPDGKGWTGKDLIIAKSGCWFNFMIYKFYSILSGFILWINYKYNKRRERILGYKLIRIVRKGEMLKEEFMSKVRELNKTFDEMKEE